MFVTMTVRDVPSTRRGNRLMNKEMVFAENKPFPIKKVL